MLELQYVANMNETQNGYKLIQCMTNLNEAQIECQQGIQWRKQFTGYAEKLCPVKCDFIKTTAVVHVNGIRLCF
jgi:hypothetical protein